MFSAFDVLMGSDWLQSNGALLDYLARTVTLQMSANKTVLKCEPTTPILAPHCAHILAKHSHATVSAKVAYKWLRKGGQSLVALISSQPVNPTPPPANLLSVHPTPSPANVLSNDPVPHSHPITSPYDNPINYPTSIPPDVEAQLTTLISEFEDVFAPFNKLPPQRPVGHTIPLQPGCKPPALPSYKMSQPELLEMKKQVAAFLEQGIIEPSSSPYAAPVLFVKKKSGELRMCVDYRQYPLPRVDDLFDRLAGCTVFSSLDLQAGYHQIRIPDEDVPKTAFRTPTGLYQFKVLCFGLTIAPATFQRVMNNAFADVINDCALVYIDDILIMSKSVPDHFNHLRRVLELLRKHQFQAKQSKCEFLKTALKSLGHIVSDQGIAVDPDKEASFGGGGSYCAAAASGAAAAEQQPQQEPQLVLEQPLPPPPVPLHPLHAVNMTEQLLAAYAADEAFASMVDQYDQDQHGLYRTRERNQIVVPNCPELKTRILVEMHDAQFAGHVGITKTLERISRMFWWPRMRSEVRHYVANCDACQRNKSVNTKPGGLLTPLAIPYDRRLSEWWQSNVKQARHFMELAQRRQAHLANKGRKEVEYHTGQLVLLSTKNLRMKPDLPQAMARMHPVFHVSLLRPYTSEHPHLPPPVEWLDEAPLYEVEKLLAHRGVRAGRYITKSTDGELQLRGGTGYQPEAGYPYAHTNKPEDEQPCDELSTLPGPAKYTPHADPLPCTRYPHANTKETEDEQLCEQPSQRPGPAMHAPRAGMLPRTRYSHAYTNETEDEQPCAQPSMLPGPAVYAPHADPLPCTRYPHANTKETEDEQPCAQPSMLPGPAVYAPHADPLPCTRYPHANTKETESEQPCAQPNMLQGPAVYAPHAGMPPRSRYPHAHTNGAEDEQPCEQLHGRPIPHGPPTHDLYVDVLPLDMNKVFERGAWLMARGVDGYSDEVIEMYLRIHYGLAVQSIAQLNQPSDWSADNLGNLAGQYGTHTFMCKKPGHSMAMKCIDGAWSLLDSMETTPTPLSHIPTATMRTMHQLFVITPNTRSREQMRMCAEKDIHHIISHVEQTGHGHNATAVDPAHPTVTARNLDPSYMERQVLI
ncbi:hypothetical protein QJQ45_002465 [Haematococcus lacustris]|nr:hypothetical protein QJQ45_002465 [Haematococcus lacustris]